MKHLLTRKRKTMGNKNIVHFSILKIRKTNHLSNKNTAITLAFSELCT